MKKEQFKDIVNNYKSTSEDVSSLKKLANDYPFSQIVHLLLANASKKSAKKDFNPSLASAAFHSTDRTILKSLIEHNLVPSEVARKPMAKPVQKTNPLKKANKVSLPKSSNIDPDILIAEVLYNLDQLQKTKKATASLFEDTVSPKKTVLTPKAPPTKKVARKTITKKKAPTAKKQTSIIEKFINEEPSITKNAQPKNDKEDMAKGSVKMRDDVVTESLAKIYVKQKKNSKAIEIYKKLIWKFPQKKALFAAQIEKLKKK